MDAAKKLAGKHNLQDLVPLNALSDSRFAEISQKIVVEEIKKGRYLFRTGDRDNQSIYLLDGKVNLIDGHRKVTGDVEAGVEASGAVDRVDAVAVAAADAAVDRPLEAAHR